MSAREHQFREPCTVSTFMVDGRTYRHDLFPKESDQVELLDENLETILEFSSDLHVRNKDGRVGQILLERRGSRDVWAYYEGPLRTRVEAKSHDLLKFEVEISKRYLAAQREAQHA